MAGTARKKATTRKPAYNKGKTLPTRPPWPMQDEELYGDWVWDAQCSICNTPIDLEGYMDFRATMREMFTHYPITTIYRELDRWFSQWDPKYKFSYTSLWRHLNKHMAGQFATSRALRLVEARKDGKLIEGDLVENYFSPMASLRQMAHYGETLLAQGRLKMSAGDLIRLYMVLHQFETEGELQARFTELVMQNQALGDYVMEVLTPKQRKEFADKIMEFQQSRRMEALQAAGITQAPPTSVIVTKDFQQARRRSAGKVQDPDEEGF